MGQQCGNNWAVVRLENERKETARSAKCTAGCRWSAASASPDWSCAASCTASSWNPVEDSNGCVSTLTSCKRARVAGTRNETKFHQRQLGQVTEHLDHKLKPEKRRQRKRKGD